MDEQAIGPAKTPRFWNAYDFSKFQVVADIGGGQGSTLAAVLERYPSLQGILFDKPSVVAQPAPLDASGVRARCDVVGGDMLEALPRDADLYMVKRVLMICGDAEALTVLKNCVAHVRSGGKVLVVEMVMPPVGVSGPPFAGVDSTIFRLRGQPPRLGWAERRNTPPGGSR